MKYTFFLLYINFFGGMEQWSGVKFCTRYLAIA